VATGPGQSVKTRHLKYGDPRECPQLTIDQECPTDLWPRKMDEKRGFETRKGRGRSSALFMKREGKKEELFKSLKHSLPGAGVLGFRGSPGGGPQSKKGKKISKAKNLYGSKRDGKRTRRTETKPKQRKEKEICTNSGANPTISHGQTRDVTDQERKKGGVWFSGEKKSGAGGVRNESRIDRPVSIAKKKKKH